MLLISSLSVQASDRNGLCNFLLELGEGVQMDSTYKMTSVGFENIKLKHQEKIMTKLDYVSLLQTTVNIPSLQRGLASVCRYKKWEINKVRIDKTEEGIMLELHYEVIPKDSKSKNQAVWARA